MLRSFSFFFSSRRRHTRWTGDWSSDVCSSDLLMVTKVKALFGYDDALDAFGVHGAGGTIGALLTGRSEERRVGKECRSRWWADHWKAEWRVGTRVVVECLQA